LNTNFILTCRRSPPACAESCPRCGRGHLFSGYLTVGEALRVLRARLRLCRRGRRRGVVRDAGRRHAWRSAGALFVEMAWQPAYWIHALVAIPLAVLLPLALLRPVKGVLIAQQYRTKAEEGRIPEPYGPRAATSLSCPSACWRSRSSSGWASGRSSACSGRKDLIARMTEQAASEPLALSEIEARQAAGEDVEFMRVTATGRFVHDSELFVFTTLDGEMGWKLVTPLDMGDGNAVLVDRGFIPYDLKAPLPGPKAGPTARHRHRRRCGPIRRPERLFAPDNDVDANIWHWWALPAMAEAAGLDEAAPFILQAEPRPAIRPGRGPRPPTLRPSPTATSAMPSPGSASPPCSSWSTASTSRAAAAALNAALSPLPACGERAG
jgi:cytochrome oxidase assembly protein ShyY1/uncharacterized protein (DUF983 family)